MRFANPYFLIFLVFPIIYIYFKYFAKKKIDFSTSLTFSSISLFKKNNNIFVRYYNKICDFFLISSLIFIIIALARPLGGNSVTTDQFYGIDIILCLDVSGSMLCYDGFPTHLPYRDILGQRVYYDYKKTLYPFNRLNSAKRVIEEYIDKQEFNRIGLVVFAGYSYTKSPLTFDKNMLKEIVKSIEFDPENDGTAIGMGIATSINRIKNSRAKSKIIILLTDGNNNTGLIDPLSAAAISTNYGIKIYTIGLGNKTGFLQPVKADFTEYVLNPAEGLDENTLTKIAEISGGKFFRAYDPESLRNIYDEIDKLEKAKIDVKRRIFYKENFYDFLFTGFIIFLIYLILNLFYIKIP